MRIGIDLGGTKIEVAVLDRHGREVLRRRAATPRDDYAATVAAVAALVREAEAAAGAPCTVGVGTPGSPSPATGLMRNCNSTWLNGRPLQADLERALGRPVRLANDADCFALSEAVDGAGAGAESVFGVILGTGVGAGVVVGGRLLAGPNRTAGEWGHNPLPWASAEEFPGPPCWCGKQGCIETWLSGPALAADHERVTGHDWDAREIVRRATAGDAACAATLSRHAGRLGRALAHVVNLLDPAVIVLGGGLSALPGLADRLPEEMRPWVFSDCLLTRVVLNRHGDSGGVRGAAWLWPDAG